MVKFAQGMQTRVKRCEGKEVEVSNTVIQEKGRQA